MDGHGLVSEAAQPTSSAAAGAYLAEMAALQATALSQSVGVDLTPWEHLAAQVQPPDVDEVVAQTLWLARTCAVEGALLQTKQAVESVDVDVVEDWKQQALVSWCAPEEPGVGLAARWVEEATSEGLSLAASSVVRWADEVSASSLLSSSLMTGLEVLPTAPTHESVATALRAAGDGPTSWAGAAIATLPLGSDLWPDVAASWWGGEPTGAFAAVELLSEHFAKVPTVTATSLLSSGLAASINDVLNQTAAGLAAAGTSFCESLRGPAVSAALFDAGAVVAPVRPAAFPAPGTVPAPVPSPVVESPAQEPTVDRLTEVDPSLRREVARPHAVPRTPPSRLSDYAITMLVLTAWPGVERLLGAAVDLVQWVNWELLWVLLVHFVAWWTGGSPA